MIQELQLRILPQQAANEQAIIQYISREKGLDARTIKAVRVLKRGIDARQRTIYVNLTVRVFINEMPPKEDFIPMEVCSLSSEAFGRYARRYFPG